MSRKHIPLAIVYDFDGTLAPGNLQENSFIPDVEMKPADFWAEAQQLAQERQADPILMYMFLMLKKADAAGVSVRKEDFRKRGRGIPLFEGVLGWFDRINEYGKTNDVRVEHYIVSSGNVEIIEGTPIASKFTKIYASKFLFDANGAPNWPALAVNYTTKTQYLFRINKGAHDLSDNSKINEFVEKEKRPIPFENMIYIGDGATDVPCFRLVKDQGGISIAVFRPSTRGAREHAERFLQEGRVHSVAPANYSEGGKLEEVVRRRIEAVAAREALNKTLTNGC